MSSMACWLTNPHRVSRRPGSSSTDAPRSAVRLADYSRHYPSVASDGAVKHRLVSGMTRIDLSRRTARLGSHERGQPPKRLPGPLPNSVICGHLMVGLVGDTVGDVRILERQDPEWLVTNHRPRPHLEPPHLCSEPRTRLVEEMWPGAHLLAVAQESHAFAWRSLRYVPVGFESVEPSPETALSHQPAAAHQLHDQLGGQLASQSAHHPISWPASQLPPPWKDRNGTFSL